MTGRNAIEARGLSRAFGELTAVDGLDLVVPEQCIYGFLGPNGSGKSTTIRMLCGLLTPTAGTARVLGCEVPAEAEILRRKLGYMTQRFSLYEDLTVEENLRFLGSVHSLRGRVLTQRIARQTERFELGDRTSQIAGTLSGGQRQRLALAAVTLHDPELLFLDEPTSAVDPETRRTFWDHLFEMVEQGTTILVSTHFMDEAERCHRLVILDEGRVVADGVPDELMRDLGAVVIEIRSERPRAAREAIVGSQGLWHVAQLGNKLHALLDPALTDPETRLRGLLTPVDANARVRRIGANLEDVFVMATSGTPDA
ncbi:MAG TPA: ABC transporter ATP-binding protein [Pseudomonadales bacterium]